MAGLDLNFGLFLLLFQISLHYISAFPFFSCYMPENAPLKNTSLSLRAHHRDLLNRDRDRWELLHQHGLQILSSLIFEIDSSSLCLPYVWEIWMPISWHCALVAFAQRLLHAWWSPFGNLASTLLRQSWRAAYCSSNSSPINKICLKVTCFLNYGELMYFFSFYRNSASLSTPSW